MICPKCKQEISKGAKFCSNCGYKLNKNYKFNKNANIIRILTLIVIIVCLFIYSAVRGNNNISTSTIAPNKNAGFSSADSASKFMKSINDSKLRNYMLNAQFDSMGVGLSCDIKFNQSNDGTALALVKVSNANNSKSIYVVYTDLSLIDENGNVYPADNSTFAMANRLPDLNLEGGNHTQGLVVFKVPKNENRFILKYNYDSVNNKSLYKPILIAPPNVDTKTSSANATNTTENNSNSNSNINNYINGSDVKCIRRTSTILEIDMKVNIGNDFVGTLYANEFIVKQGNSNGIKSYSALFSDSPNATKSTVNSQDQIDPTPGDNYYVTMFFNVNPDLGNNFSLYYSYAGLLIPLNN